MVISTQVIFFYYKQKLEQIFYYEQKMAGIERRKNKMF